MEMGAEEKERIRRAYYMERKSVRQIAKEEGRSRKTVKQVVESEGREVKREQGRRGRQSPSVYEPYRRRVEELLEEQRPWPEKQQYTAARIYEVIREEGYGGCESRVRQEVGKWKRRRKPAEVYIPLDYEPGEDAQCDWGEAVVVLGGREVKVQVFVLRMCYSRKLYVQAFPTQRLECFLQAHRDAFAYFGGVPQRIIYDNVATAVHISHEGGERKREETRSFVGLRSHYLFEARFCTPFAPQEKGGVENGVGYMRERMFVPLPRVKSYEELNGLLRKRCDRENERKVRGETKSIGEMWEQDRRQLRAMPEGGYECAEIREARVTPYSQVIFETNRYSVPVKRGREQVTVKASAFQVEIVEGVKVLARHERSYEREEDVLDPLHYVTLIRQKPGSFEHALPLKKWKKQWPACYGDLLKRLREKWPEGRGVKEFMGILALHRQYSARVMEMAIKQALAYGCVHLDGVEYCLSELLGKEAVGNKKGEEERREKGGKGQGIDLARYEAIVTSRW